MKASGTIKGLLLIVALVAALGLGYLFGVGRADAPAETGLASTVQTQYTCGMHPMIIRDEPGLCPICNMKLTPVRASGGQAGATASGERKIKHWQAPMDPTYIRNEPGKSPMGMDLVPVYEDEIGVGTDTVTIDPVTMQNMGVRTAAVVRRNLARTVRAVGLITYEEPRQYSVNSKIEGWVERLVANQAGQRVKKGQPLMELYSPDLVAAQHEYLLALESSRRLGASSFPEIAESSRRLLDAARTRLRYWDITEKQIQELERSGEVRKTLTLYSPYDGVVTMKNVTEGMRVMAGEELLQISDISRVWVHADIYEYETSWVKLGQAVSVELPYASGRVLEGKVTYLYPYVEPKSRTVQVRIALANPDLELKPDMFVNVSIETQPVEDVLTIPDNAVLNSGRGQTVFVALGDGRFEPRAVQTGVSDDEGFVQIVSGLTEGERVVTSAQFMLDSESNLREAIQKMLSPQGERPSATAEEEDLEDLFRDGKNDGPLETP